MITYNSAEAIQDVPGATYAALKARFAALAAVVDAVGAERKALWDEIKHREKAAAVTVRLGALKESDKVVCLEVLKAPVKADPGAVK